MEIGEEQILERRRKVLFLSLSIGQLLLCVCVLLFCNIKYEVSDDFIMEMVASGAYTGEPDAHIMFSNIILGEVLTLFYRINSDISWYFVAQVFLCFCSYIAVTYVFSHRLSMGAAVFSVVTLTAFTAQDLYILPQFTKTALAASMSGLILLIYGLFYKRKHIVCIFGALLAISGALVRQKAFYIAVLFAGVIVIYESIRVLCTEKWGIKKVSLGVWLPGAILLAAVFLCGEINDLSYTKNSDYSYYREFSIIRSQILDYYFPGYSECPEKFEAIGVSPNDYEMILNWDFADPDFFTVEKLQQVLDIVRECRNNRHSSVIDALRSIKYRQLRYPITICCMILGVLCILANPKKSWAPVASAAIAVILLCHFYFVNRNVYRVEFGILYSAAALVAYFLEIRFSKKQIDYALFAAAVAVAILRVPSYLPDKSWSEMDDDQYRTMVYDTYYYSWDYGHDKYSKVIEPGEIRKSFLSELRDNPDKLYVLDFSTCIQTFYYDFSIFTSSRSVFPKNAVFLAGVTEYHPSVGKYMQKLGNDNLMEMLLEDNVYFVGNNSPQMLLQYYHEHGKENVELEPLGIIDDYQIWKYTLA